MSIFSQYSASDIKENFTHYGWFAWCCPVYIDMRNAECPSVDARNWVPEFWFGFCAFLFGAFVFLWTFIDPQAEPMFPIQITGEVK